MTEEWRQITDYPNYEISNLGQVRNSKRNHINKLWLCKGYQATMIRKDKKAYNKLIHKLVAEAFIPNPDNLPIIDHIDRNPLNNSIDNLRWGTISQNAYNRQTKSHSSKYRGVSWDNYNNKWKSSIYINGKSKHIGQYETEEEGAKAFNEFVISHDLGEFIELNIIE